MPYPNLTIHERHARLVKIVRRRYQEENPGSRLFNNTSGTAWQGNAVSGANKVELLYPRIIRFGIPEPMQGENEGSGGSDLLGERLVQVYDGLIHYFVPVLTGIECKAGKSKLKKNQKVFRDWMKRINAIWFLARECTCWDSWIPVWKGGKIIDWEIPSCHGCGGKGYNSEDN